MNAGDETLHLPYGESRMLCALSRVAHNKVCRLTVFRVDAACACISLSRPWLCETVRDDQWCYCFATVMMAGYTVTAVQTVSAD